MLERAARNRSPRLNQALCIELARAIGNGLQGILPRAFAAAAGLHIGSHARASVPREVRATAHILAKKYGYIVDRSPVKTLLDVLNIDRRTWYRRAEIKMKKR